MLQGPGYHLQGHVEHRGKRGRVCELEQQRAGPEALLGPEAQRHPAGPRESQLLQVRGPPSRVSSLPAGEERPKLGTPPGAHQAAGSTETERAPSLPMERRARRARGARGAWGWPVWSLWAGPRVANSHGLGCRGLEAEVFPAFAPTAFRRLDEAAT